MSLLDQAEVEARLAAGALPGWAADAWIELRDKVLDPAFPCTFGTVAAKKGDLLLAFVDAPDDEALVTALAACCEDYATFVRAQPLVRASLVPLAIAMPPRRDCPDLDAYFQVSWRLLQAVHARDPSPWPADVPTDPNDPRWSFCFSGVAFFVNFKTPLHRARRSRRMAHAYLWLVQARAGFDVVAGDTPQGRHARQLIRTKLEAYDPLPPHPALAHYGSPDNREWQQYFVPDDNDAAAPRCPFHVLAREEDDPAP